MLLCAHLRNDHISSRREGGRSLGGRPRGRALGTLSWPLGHAPLRAFAQRPRPDYHSAALAAVGQGAALPRRGGWRGSQPLECISMASPIHPQLRNLMAVESTARNLWLLRRRSGGLGLTAVADTQSGCRHSDKGSGRGPGIPSLSGKPYNSVLWLFAHSRSSRLLLQVWEGS